MPDLPTDFWGGYIVGITVISFAALGWLIYGIYFSNGGDAEIAEHLWDEDLREGTNPAPLWWFWLIFALMIFSVIYLMLYPGLGSFSGVMRWSQGGEMAASLVEFDQEFGSERERLTALSYAELAGEEMALNAGRHVFSVHCSVCHGSEAQGQVDMFPSLRDAEWQWGDDEAQIERSIRTGRTGVMPPWQTALNDDGVADMTEYVIAMSEGRGGDAELADTRASYTEYCSACHGAEGEGNVVLGATPLNEDDWTYGGDYDAVYESIAVGRIGEMPSFDDRLSATQIKLVTAWVKSQAE